jgi:hypothetical protein
MWASAGPVCSNRQREAAASRASLNPELLSSSGAGTICTVGGPIPAVWHLLLSGLTPGDHRQAPTRPQDCANGHEMSIGN